MSSSFEWAPADTKENGWSRRKALDAARQLQPDDPDDFIRKSTRDPTKQVIDKQRISALFQEKGIPEVYDTFLQQRGGFGLDMTDGKCRT